MMRGPLLRLVLLATAGLIFALAPAADKVVLGKLGQAMERTAIYAAPSSQSRVFYRAKPYQYLVVRTGDRPNWLRVVLSNGALGFVRQDKVAVLPYTITVDRPRTGTIPGSSRGAVSRQALNYVGTPYVWGGNDIMNGIDCSGFVKQLYGSIGMSLPRTAAEQARVGAPITRLEDLQAGDRLYFWEAKRNKIGHTGIYLGNGYFVHSSRGRGGVATDYLGAPQWRRILVAARR